MENLPVGIVGAGPVGCLLALVLAQKGEKVHVFEKRPLELSTSENRLRSINLALSHRGLKALGLVNAEEAAKKIAIPMYGRMVHVDKTTHFQPYDQHGSCIYSISRGGLNQLLVEKTLQEPHITTHFEHYFEGKSGNKVRFKTNDSVEKSFPVSFLWGADGAFSQVRAWAEGQGFTTKTSSFTHGYKEADLPAGPHGEFLLEKNALHIWPRKRFMLIALPNVDGSFTCTLFLDLNGNNSFEKFTSKPDYTTFILEHFPDLEPFVETLAEQFHRHPLSKLFSVQCSPWVLGNEMALIGDAAHAILPFYGQGMNAGLEDVSYWESISINNSLTWEEKLSQWSIERQKQAEAIRILAENNFIEMRDKVSDSVFLQKKKLERHLETWLPNDWIPQYSRVTFSHAPYSEALEKGSQQDVWLGQLVENLGKLSDAEIVEQKVAILGYLFSIGFNQHQAVSN